MELIDYKNLNASISSSLSNGWAKMMKYFLPLFLVVVIIMVIEGPFSMSIKNNTHLSSTLVFFGIIAFIFGTAYFFLLKPIFRYSGKFIFIQAIRDKEVEVRNIIKGFDNYWNIVLANLLTTMLIGLAFIALIIPGIFVACRLAFVPYLVMDKNMEAIEAVETSWKLTKGYGWKIFGLALISIGIIIGGLLAFFVGIFPASIWISASYASLYQGCLNEKAYMFEYENNVDSE